MERGIHPESLRTVIGDVHRALIPATTDSEIERRVCERLARSALYESAWVADYDAEAGVVVPKVAAGTELHDEIPLDGGSGRAEPLGRAIRTGAAQVSRQSGDEASDSSANDLPSNAAVPLVHEGALHGVLVLSAIRPEAFDTSEREGLSELAEDVAYGLATIEATTDVDDERTPIETESERAEAVQGLTEADQPRPEWGPGFVERALDGLPDIIFCFDVHGRFVRWSDELEAVTGYSGEEIAEMDPTEFFTGDDVAKATDAIQRVLDERRSKAELSLVTKDGEEIPYDFTAVRIDGADGEPVGIAGIARDISEQRLLHETIRSVSESETFEDAAGAAIERVCEATDWEYGEAWTPSPDGDRMERTSAAYAESDVLLPFQRASETTPMPLGVGLPGRVWRSREPHWIRDVSAGETAETFPRIDVAREVGVKTAVGVPILGDDGDEVVAALCFYVRERLDRDERRIETVSSVAAELGAVLAQKRAQDEISRQRDQLSTLKDRLLETIPTGVMTFDADGELLQCNRRATEILGLSADEIATVFPVPDEWEVVDADDRPVPGSEYPFRRVLEAGEPVSDVELKLKRPNGEPIWVLVNGAPVLDRPGEVSEAVFAFEDVTERKRREQERRRVIEALETAREGISLLDDDGEFVYVNDAYADIFGYDPEEMLGEHWDDLGIEDDPEYVYDEVLPAVADEGKWTGTTTGVRSDDSTFVAEHSLTHTEQDELVCVVRDVTERERRERDLRETEAQLKAAAEAGSVGTWVWDIREDRIYSDAAFAKLFGADPDVARDGAPLDTFISAIHEDDWERVARKLLDAIESRGEYEAEYRVRNADGELRWVVERGHVECDDEGNPVRFPGAAADITERKRIEQELRKSEKQLRALIELLPVAVFVAEDDGRIVEWNEAAEEIWGGEVAESESVAEYEAYDGWWADTGERIEPHEWPLARALRGEEVTDPDVIEIEGFDGKRRTVLNHGIPVRDENGEVSRAVVTLIDVTEREEREQRLQEQNERLESFASMLAHELRNPLSIAQIYLQNVRDDDSAFAEVETALDRMEKMIDILLVLTRGADSVIESEPVALGEIATEAWSEVGGASDRLVVETDSTLQAEPHHLRHMLENLFRNAVEHGNDDVTVRVGRLDAPNEGFYVADDGSGIPESERDRIFEAGYTTDAAGIGLGLTFIAQIADAYGWEYAVTASDQGGARFEFANVDLAAER